MSERLYAISDQIAGMPAPPDDPGYDVVPGNVIKMAIVLLSINPFTGATIITSNGWQTALTADPLGVYITKYIDNFTIPASEVIAEGGGDSTTWNGVRRVRALNSVTGTGMISGISHLEYKAMKKFISLSGNFQQGTRLGLIFFHEGTAITALSTGKAIPAYNIVVTDPPLGGKLGASFDVNISFDLPGGWASDIGLFEAAAGFAPSNLENAPA
ncbi:hypothetical protein [Tellurirhabdus bombi]|uniref:hypothetical protein n=1 Tax=Tellurirhabdus bombi TaxID=2907205 RepID=UPI001F467487|nr:hypothetical protein [Tellurirhabdus bombi]